jgi:drug/metabolite transporter (DMT)-like permease
MTGTFLGVPWLVWGGVCLVIAAIYVVVWPRPKTSGLGTSRPAWRHLVLRWFHPLVWVLLAISCFIRPIVGRDDSSLANGIALLALVVYAIFMGTLALDRTARRT